jgi:hypothetical protein
MTTDFGLNKSMADKEADKRKAMVDEMYYGEAGKEEPKEEEEKGELSQLFDAYMEHRKQKQQPALKNILGR